MEATKSPRLSLASRTKGHRDVSVSSLPTVFFLICWSKGFLLCRTSKDDGEPLLLQNQHFVLPSVKCKQPKSKRFCSKRAMRARLRILIDQQKHADSKDTAKAPRQDTNINMLNNGWDYFGDVDQDRNINKGRPARKKKKREKKELRTVRSSLHISSDNKQ